MTSLTCEVELPSEDDQGYNAVDPSGNISREVIPGASMFRLSVKLIGILHRILQATYLAAQPRLVDKSGSRDAELLRQSLELNDQLDEFLATMPDRLSSFVAISPSQNYSRACNFTLHEQALITRSVRLSSVPH